MKTLLLIFALAFYSYAQVTDSIPSGKANKSQEVQQAEARINQIVNESEKYFKQGELNIKDERLSQAWENFDKSVEIILASGINVSRNFKLNDYYLQLIERIYRLEAIAKKKSIQNKENVFEISPKCIKSESKNEKELSEAEKETAKKVVESLTQAINFYKSGDNDEAASKLRFVLANEPMSAVAYLLLGKIHFRRGDIQQAVSSLKTALFWDNKLIEAHILLGKIYFEKGDNSQAKNFSESALAIDSENSRAQALSRIIESRASNDDRRIIEDDSNEVEILARNLKGEGIDNTNNRSNVILAMPFQGVYEDNLLNKDFAYVLSKVLTIPSLCVVSNDEREKLIQDFGFSTDETFTLATALKFANLSRSNLLVVGKYVKTLDSINTTTQIIRVNEGRFLSEEFPDGKRVQRVILLKDSLSNLRVMQGQIAYQILYQYDKMLPYSQNHFTEAASNIKIPASLNFSGNLFNEPDFSTKTFLKKTICGEDALGDIQLRNFRLGLTFNEAAKILPKATLKNINSYEKQMSQKFSIAGLKDERFKDISSIQLQFFDNRLYSIEILYDDNIIWKNLSEFASQVEKSLSLSKMKSGEYEFDGNYLYCGNYQIKVMLTNYKRPAIHLFDTTVFNKIIQRRQEEKSKILQQKIEEEKRKKQIEEEKKKVFKP
jgi:Tfp pilus assembly protein PilF